MRLAFYSFLSLLIIPAHLWAASSDDSIDQINRQIAYVDQQMQKIEDQRQSHESERKSLKESYVGRFALEKKQKEERLAEQFKGWSNSLSRIPELPSFHGSSEGQTQDKRPTTND